MENENRIIGEILIDKDTTVYFIDQSRPITGGRWQVQLLILVPLKPRESHFAGYPDPTVALREFTSLIGKASVEFQVVKVRNFIAEKEVESTLEGMKEDFINSGLDYLKKPNFAGNCIRKKYEALRNEEAIRRAHAEALRTAQ